MKNSSTSLVTNIIKKVTNKLIEVTNSCKLINHVSLFFKIIVQNSNYRLL